MESVAEVVIRFQPAAGVQEAWTKRVLVTKTVSVKLGVAVPVEVPVAVSLKDGETV